MQANKFLLETGGLLAKYLEEFSSLDNLKLLQEMILSYSGVCERYAESNSEFPESFAVDLNEALLFKLSNSSEWRVYLNDFRQTLESYR